MTFLKEIWDTGSYQKKDDVGYEPSNVNVDGKDAWIAEYKDRVIHYMEVEPHHSLIGINAHNPNLKAAVAVVEKLWTKHKKKVNKKAIAFIKPALDEYITSLWDKYQKKIETHGISEMPSFTKGDKHKPDAKVVGFISDAVVDALIQSVKPEEKEQLEHAYSVIFH